MLQERLWHGRCFVAETCAGLHLLTRALTTPLSLQFMCMCGLKESGVHASASGCSSRAEGGRGGRGGADREAYMQTNTHVYQDFRGSSMMLRHV